ncbi:dihydrolipoyllysine-residue succinyltransferase [Oecophyllibacter saccharovorans]|uniref:Dihydrolipoyllysine-residue succinyltransferase n=1 Tax=Oecophyllibacter saccharovorans TaxID=2558360 RepID=A0A506UKX4_9PROT|nr:dihydrolipoyllysine-residue succinyltransferase [Oecophyllibacter saccharovorans]TPW34001.1 dihydrolipoyllysine-residue succinyltransferase [Oecophyllibacter saccharovorans]
MSVEIRVPELGESLTVATVARWLKQPGSYVKEGEPLLELETDKVSLEVPAPVSGEIRQNVPEGQEVEVGQALGVIDETAAPPVAEERPQTERPAATAPTEAAAEKPSAPQNPPSSPASPTAAPQSRPAAEQGVAEQTLSQRQAPEEEGVRRVPMSRLRQTIARNLKSAQNTAAILTTFNEVDMSAVRDMRARYRDLFEKRHEGTRLGFMSFFARAVTQALSEFPSVNAQIEGDEIVYRDHVNLGIAVGTERGLVVPVLRHADEMSFAEIERRIADFGKRARMNALKLQELSGGTFTITNGGIFGSLLSTPILNAPQSGVLGMHAIQDRPVARDGEVVIRPMMYIALSYDHRLVDGREAVSFLVRVKENLEDPRRLLLGV